MASVFKPASSMLAGVGVALFLASTSAHTQQAAQEPAGLQSSPPQVGSQGLLKVAHLTATATAEAAQDFLEVVLGATLEGPTAATVQALLIRAVDAALVMGRQASQPGQLQVRSGNFSLQPRQGRDGQMTGWQGTAQVILEGRDFARITAQAGRMSSLSVQQVNFSLSRELQAQLQAQAQSEAIAQFKRDATLIVRDFGLSSYTLREVQVGPQSSPWPTARPMFSMARMADVPLPAEAGKGSVSVTVTGSVQMH